MTIKKTTLAIFVSTALTISLNARDQIKIVGSSTVYPFASAVAEELGATTKYPTPVVESTGSGGGIKLFCSGIDLNTPDITNASRRMKAKEFQLCEKNGVTNITEAIIGFDGIAFAQSSSNEPFSITKKQLALAVAAEVPDKNGKLVANPYKKWSDIDSSLPNKQIIIYGPPKSSGTRDAFEEMVMQATFKNMKEYTSLYEKDKVANKGYKKYSKVRQDGVYVPSGENDNIIVQKLNKNTNAFGIFGYSFLVENDDKLIGAKVDGVMPTPEAIASNKYPIARSLFFYIKNDHENKVPAIKDYVKLFMDEIMIGRDGILTEIGLIPLPEETRKAVRESILKREKVTLESLKTNH